MENNHNQPVGEDVNQFVGPSRMWHSQYPHPIERFPHYRNHFYEPTTTQSAPSTSETNVTQVITPTMGTLQTVLTTGINPSVNNHSHQNIHATHVQTHTPQNHSMHSQNGDPNQIITRTRLHDLIREVDPNEQIDDDVEEVLLQIADDFVENAITNACLLAKHRKASTVDVKDMQLHLERNCNLWIPGFGTEDLRPYKRSSVTEAHKQRLALIRKTLKKY